MSDPTAMNLRYTRTAIGLHWLMAVMIIGTFSVGLYMHDLPLSPFKLKIYSWHKWTGVILALLLLLRLGWKLGHRPPPLAPDMPRWQQLAASSTHHLLYALMLAIPLSGWLMSSALGFQTVVFGVLPLPDLLAKNKELGEVLKTVHMSLNFSMAALVVAHVGAALKHHFVNRDDTLQRMLPFLASRKF